MSRVKPWSAAMWLANSLILSQFRCMSLPQLMHFKSVSYTHLTLPTNSRV